MAVEPVIEIKTPQSPPAWALLERELLKTNSAACREFYKRYFDERGWLLCVERWGGDDGPDDAIENLMDWPILHALGGSDDVLKMIQKAWEGHLRQYTLAKTRDVPMARDGMYYKEFPVMFDWLHNGEGLCVFNLQGLSEAHEDAFRRRVRRFAGFYMNEDPGAPNYDPKHKIIKSMFNGSRGPLLRKATALDWAGDPIEVKNRFQLGHGETSYKEMLQHFETYNDIVGDHPLNLVATTLALNAFMLDNEEKYKKWLLEYVDAWLDRMAANNDIIPTNIGLDGKIGGETGGKWYGGVYGWGFTMKMPDGKLVNRNQQFKGMVGFMNAYLLTGNDQYLESWRKQIDAVNAQKKTVDGIVKTPTMFGEQGWYGYVPGLYQMGALDIYHLSMKQADRARVPANQWLDYLEGKNAKYPENYLRHDLERVRQKVQAMRGDTTTPDTRLADDPMKFTPANVNSMIALAMGGLPPGKAGGALFCRLRYFDPENRRSGLPEDTAALIEKMTADQVVVSLANVNQLEQRTVMVQAGGYAEHQFLNATIDGKEIGINGTAVKVRLAPGAGGTLTINMKRYVNPPTLSVPWKR
ncbi:MAG: hypothetical protein K8T89_21680 [Planctomycetes bacterium]|nr:hypothetical protein [Planctomycetota bacterium]